MRSNEIEKLQQRTRRYWYEDGLNEIAAGCLAVLVGLLFFVEASASAGSLPANFSAIMLPIVLIGGIWIAGRVVHAVKARLTYPRTGYIAYRQPSSTRRVATGLVAAVLAVFVVELLRVSQTPGAWVPTLDGLVIGAFFLYMGHTLGLGRFYALSLLSVLAGAGASWGGLGETAGSAAYFVFMGVALIASGGHTLWAYLNQTTPPTE